MSAETNHNESNHDLHTSFAALMPGGDHLNIIDPPGLTVMRIAGGRYRVTAAHRVVWTWMNEFVSLIEKHDDDDSEENSNDRMNRLQVGDLVTMTIVDVFETDNQGKLLSYCPTFDNRAITKTHQTAETLRKSSNRVLTMLAKARKSKTAKTILAQAQYMADTVKQKVGEAVHQYNNGGSNQGSPPRKSASLEGGSANGSASSPQYRIPADQDNVLSSALEATVEINKQRSYAASTNYHGDDDSERHEV